MKRIKQMDADDWYGAIGVFVLGSLCVFGVWMIISEVVIRAWHLFYTYAVNQ